MSRTLNTVGFDCVFVINELMQVCIALAEGTFSQHWLFWQELISLYNEKNPSGNITSSDRNYQVNGTAVVVGFIIALKRLWWGLYLGKRSYREYHCLLEQRNVPFKTSSNQCAFE